MHDPAAHERTRESTRGLEHPGGAARRNRWATSRLSPRGLRSWGCRKQTVVVVGWIWLAVIAWDVRRPWREHLAFLRDWWLPLGILTVYLFSRGLSDDLGFVEVHVTEPLSIDRWLFGGVLPTEWLQAELCGVPCERSRAAAVVRRGAHDRLLFTLLCLPRRRRCPVGSQPDPVDRVHASLRVTVGIGARRLRRLPDGTPLDGCPRWLPLSGCSPDHGPRLVRPRSLRRCWGRRTNRSPPWAIRWQRCRPCTRPSPCSSSVYGDHAACACPGDGCCSSTRWRCRSCSCTTPSTTSWTSSLATRPSLS